MTLMCCKIKKEHTKRSLNGKIMPSDGSVCKIATLGNRARQDRRQILSFFQAYYNNEATMESRTTVTAATPKTKFINLSQTGTNLDKNPATTPKVKPLTKP